MPIIINEIEVSVDVAGSNAASTGTAAAANAAINKEEIIRECVEQVLEILARKNER